MKKNLKRAMAMATVFATVLSTVFTGGVGQNPEAQAASKPKMTRVSVHDPSIFKDTHGDGTYYVFGSHLATASSKDLLCWSQISSDYSSVNNNPVYGDIDTNLADPFAWAGKGDTDSDGDYSVWAPDVIYNPYYVNEDNSKGAYMLYVSTSSTSVRSAIGFMVSQTAAGPYEYKETLIYSGFTKADAYDNGSSVNKNYTNTNIDEVVEGVNSSWFNGDTRYNSSYAPNAIDPNVFFGADGKLYMSYGSWSGGIFLLELDPATGKAKYPGREGTDGVSGNYVDRYFGTHIAGGQKRSGEAPYIYYDKEAGYYYLYITYGWLQSTGGYNMRLFRSKNPTGPYVDAKGQKASENYTNLNQYGVKIFGNYQFNYETGYMAAGHNSAFVDEDGQRYIFYHQRFDDGSEVHQLRVRKQFLSEDGWPVSSTYEYQGESPEEYTDDQVVDVYEIINQGTGSNGQIIKSNYIALTKDGKVRGTMTGTWKKTNKNGMSYLTIETDSVTYKGYFMKQYLENYSDETYMTFAAIGDNNTSLNGVSTGDASLLEDYDLEGETLTGNGWWTDVPSTQDYTMTGDGTFRFHVKVDATGENAGYNVELTSDQDQDGNTYDQALYLTTGSNVDGWYANAAKKTGSDDNKMGANGTAMTISQYEDDGGILQVGQTYQVRVTRSGQDFTINYAEESSGRSLFTIYANSTNFGQEVKIHAMAQVGTYTVYHEVEKKEVATPTASADTSSTNTSAGNSTSSASTTTKTTSKKTMKLSKVKVKKGKKKITGKLSVKKATMKVKVGSKTYKGKKIKWSGKKFTVKLKKKLKKKQKVVITVTKSGYKKLKKTYKAK
ncbi:MAG: family 43 glycosylhydrolase [Eubacterium sp.]|nr:family 43 glycosylhydrolase [Eubacterium sp.]